MKKKTFGSTKKAAVLALAMAMAVAPAAAAVLAPGADMPGVMEAKADTFSPNWYAEADGRWRLKDGDGNVVTNAWVCDDAVPGNGQDVWYLLDAEGYMIADPLVQDNTGNSYSLETRHEGYYGMLRYQSGTYDGVELTLESSHDGGFARILNQEGLDAMMAKYPVRHADVDNSHIVYTSSLSGNASGNAAGDASGNATGGTSGDTTGGMTGDAAGDASGNATGNTPADTSWNSYNEQGVSLVALEMVEGTRESNKKYGEVVVEEAVNGAAYVSYANGFSIYYHYLEPDIPYEIWAENDGKLMFKYYDENMSDQEVIDYLVGLGVGFQNGSGWYANEVYDIGGIVGINLADDHLMHWYGKDDNDKIKMKMLSLRW